MVGLGWEQGLLPAISTEHETKASLPAFVNGKTERVKKSDEQTVSRRRRLTWYLCEGGKITTPSIEQADLTLVLEFLRG